MSASLGQTGTLGPDFVHRPPVRLEYFKKVESSLVRPRGGASEDWAFLADFSEQLEKRVGGQSEHARLCVRRFVSRTLPCRPAHAAQDGRQARLQGVARQRHQRG